VTTALAALRESLAIPQEFPSDVLAQAADGQTLLDAALADPARQDRRSIPLITIDPPGSMDLDQAVHIERQNNAGYTVHYAIADVAYFVPAGSAIDRESYLRGTTIYGPDYRTPLHPPALSEGVASLLPDQDRPAALWTITLSKKGEITSAFVERAIVRSTARWTYDEVQDVLDAAGGEEAPNPNTSTPIPETVYLLKTVGTLRQEAERRRGGVSLNVPEQEVFQDPDTGEFSLAFRGLVPTEGWNAQISLLTGIAGAQIMREAGIGIFRTLPPADPRDLKRLRRTAAALGITWNADQSYGQVLDSLDATNPKHAAFLNEATTLFRGAGYHAFGIPGPADDNGQPGPIVTLPAHPGSPKTLTRHAAIAAEYAHITAPLRRLVDRAGTEVCLAHCAGQAVPEWVYQALPLLPAAMTSAIKKASSFERQCVSIVEAALLVGREGEQFSAVTVDTILAKGATQAHRGEVVIDDPAIRARVDGDNLELGARVTVTLTEASIAEGKVRFATS
jgi:exoribonuclease R